MTVLFGHVLLVSLFVTPVILLLLLLMPRLGHRYTSRLRCFIWMLMTARLLVPVHYSLQNLFRNNSPIANLLDQVDRTAVVDALQKVISDGGVAAGTVGQATHSALMNWELWGAIWLIGVVLVLCGNLIGYRVTVKRLQRWSMAVTDPFLLKTFEESKERLAISSNVCLFQTSRTNTPLLIGYIHPRIYLPARQNSASELSDVISHELCHYKRKDLWFKLALLLSNAIHWFNPVVFLMLRQAELEVEKACDSDVLRGASTFMRKQYGLTILSFAEKAQSLPTSLTTHFYGGKKQMKSRFFDIINQNNKKSGIAFLTVFALLIVFCGAWVGNDVFASSPVQKIAPEHMEMGDLPESHGNGEMAWPVPDFYTITSNYGIRHGGSDFHTGIDIADETIYGASVIATEGGTVIHVVKDYQPGLGYGMYLVIDHGGDVSTLYGNLSEILVNAGDTVEKGQIIAEVGSTGFSTEPHLQFEVRENGVPVDPVTYLMPVGELK